MTQTKQTNVRLSMMTRRQLDSLTELTGMSQSEVIQTAIDRMYQQENKMSNYIHVYLNTSEDTMMGSEGWNGYDEKDSVNAFAQQVEQEVIAAYPDAEVEVETHAVQRTVNTDIENAEDTVFAIVQDVYGSFEWLRK